MADLAFLAKLTEMHIIFGMAADTGGRRACKDAIDVTLRAGNLGMFSGQLKAG